VTKNGERNVLWEADVMLVSGSGCVSLKHIQVRACFCRLHSNTMLKKLKRRLSLERSQNILTFKHLKSQQWMHTMTTVTLQDEELIPSKDGSLVLLKIRESPFGGGYCPL